MNIETKTCYCTPETSGVKTWVEAHLLGQFMEARGWEVIMQDTMMTLSDEFTDVAERDWNEGLAWLVQRITVTQAAAEFGQKPDSLRHALQRGAFYGEKSGATWLTTRAAVASYLHKRDDLRSIHPKHLSTAL